MINKEWLTMFTPWLCIPMLPGGMVTPVGIPTPAIPGVILVIKPIFVVPGVMTIELPIIPTLGCMGVRVGAVGAEKTSKRSFTAEDAAAGALLAGMTGAMGAVAEEAVAELNWLKSAKPPAVLRKTFYIYYLEAKRERGKILKYFMIIISAL